jgi:hypothetical protein
MLRCSSPYVAAEWSRFIFLPRTSPLDLFSSYAKVFSALGVEAGPLDVPESPELVHNSLRTKSGESSRARLASARMEAGRLLGSPGRSTPWYVCFWK